jgi:hypothetical protein
VNEHCEYYVGEDIGLEGDECGLPATDAYRFRDGSSFHLCAKHWDEWVKEEMEDLAEFGDEHPLYNDIRETLALNGVTSK